MFLHVWQNCTKIRNLDNTYKNAKRPIKPGVLSFAWIAQIFFNVEKLDTIAQYCAISGNRGKTQKKNGLVSLFALIWDTTGLNLD